MAYCNLDKALYAGVGKYDIPEIDPYNGDTNIDYLLSFNYARDKKYYKGNIGLHFCIDDFKFECLWNQPNKYIENFKKCKYIVAPDFSIYYDIPLVLQLYNHYRKHWLARYYQDRGITVLPIIEWGLKESYDFCFDGEPKNSIVVVSPSGCIKDEKSYNIYGEGLEEMKKRLTPSKIICLTHSTDVQNWYDFGKNAEFIDISFWHGCAKERKD